MKVYYLNALDAGNVGLPWHSPYLENKLRSHPAIETYTLKGFQNAFNNEEIVDSGLIFIDDEPEEKELSKAEQIGEHIEDLMMHVGLTNNNIVKFEENCGSVYITDDEGKVYSLSITECED